MKSGYKTTEFWVTLASLVCGILVTVGVLTPEQQSSIVGAISKIAGGIISIIPTIAYIWSRTKIKQQNGNQQ